MNQTYPAARLRILFKTDPLISKRLKDKIAAHSESYVLYQFTCSCGARYLGNTTRRLFKRIAEHCPASLRHRTVKNVRSSIPEHLICTGHQICTEDAFAVFHIVLKRNAPVGHCRINGEHTTTIGVMKTVNACRSSYSTLARIFAPPLSNICRS